MPIVSASSMTVAPIAVHRIHESRRGMKTSPRAVAAGRLRLEQSLIRAERTAVMLGELLAHPPAETER